MQKYHLAASACRCVAPRGTVREPGKIMFNICKDHNNQYQNWIKMQGKSEWEKDSTWSCCQSRGSAEESARTSRTSWCRCRTQTWYQHIFKLSTHVIHTNVDYLLANFIASSKCALVISGTRSSSSSTSMVVAPWQEQKQLITNSSCLKFVLLGSFEGLSNTSVFSQNINLNTHWLCQTEEVTATNLNKLPLWPWRPT